MLRDDVSTELKQAMRSKSYRQNGDFAVDLAAIKTEILRRAPMGSSKELVKMKFLKCCKRW